MKNLLLLASFTFLTGCAIGPAYKSPVTALESESAWSGTGRSSLSSAAAARDWWNEFGDATLRSLVEEARSANLDIKAAEARLQQSQAALVVEASNFLPRPSASGLWERYQQSENFNQGFGGRQGSIYRGFGDVAWELDVFGRVRRQVEAASANSRGAALDKEDILSIVSTEVGRRYVELRGFQAELAVVQENVRTFREIVRLNESLLAGGQITQIQLDQSRANLELAESTLPVIEGEIETTANRIAVLLGKPPGYRRAELLKTAPQPKMPTMVGAGVPSDLLIRRPDVRAAAERIQAATAGIGIAEADLLPRFFFNGSLRLDASSFSALFAPGAGGYSFGPAFTWSGLDFWRVLAQIREARARNGELVAVYEKTVLEATAEVSNELVRWTREVERTTRLSKAVESSRSAASLAVSRYERGLEDFLTVLQAELTRLEAESQEVESQTRARLALVGLYRALGGGWNG